MREFSTEDLKRILLDIDEEAELELGKSANPYDVVIVGGCALLLSNLTDRAMTQDIDMVEFDSRLTEIISRHPEMNSAAFVYEGNLPDGWIDRLVELNLDTHVIRYLTPTPEDLAVMKLYSGREQDLEDLNSPDFVKTIDWEKLDSYVRDEEGASINLVSPRAYAEMVYTYENYRKWNER